MPFYCSEKLYFGMRGTGTVLNQRYKIRMGKGNILIGDENTFEAKEELDLIAGWLRRFAINIRRLPSEHRYKTE